MALGTPVAAAAAYNATAGGTTVTPAYPAGILATDAVLLFVGMKPSTANGGTVTTPTGWTLQDSLTGAGGYGTTLGADTGNTNLWVYSWDTPVAGQTGNLTVTLGTNNISWAFMVRIPSGGGALSYGSADGQRTTAPTVNVAFATALTNGATATNFQSGDVAIWAMCIPTDITTPGQFSAPSVTATGATFGAATELNEPDSGTGNDIGGYSAWASVTAGSSTTAPTVTVTAGGTVTNVRGPIVLLRVREAAPPPTQTLTPGLYTNTNTFHNPTVTAGAVTLTPALYTNDQTFYSADVTQTGGTQTLTPSLYTNTNTFYAATVTATRVLTPARYDNANTFYAATVNRGTITLTPARYDNPNTFYAPTVTRGTATLTPARYDNPNTFYSPVITAAGVVLAPARLDNAQTFYAATVSTSITLTAARFDNAQTFYAPAVKNTNTLTPARVNNAQTFYSPTVAATRVLTPARFDNSNTFYTTTVTGLNAVAPPLLTNSNTFFAATIAIAQPLSPSLVVNENTFFSPVVVPGVAGLVCEDYVTPGYVTPGYVEFTAFTTNLFPPCDVSDSTTIVLTGVQALGLVGYANVWGLVPNTQDADWGEIGDGQDPNWQPVVNGLFPSWAGAPAAPSANWHTTTTN